MYDCVYPTRTARFGTALVPEVLYYPPSHTHTCSFNFNPTLGKVEP